MQVEALGIDGLVVLILARFGDDAGDKRDHLMPVGGDQRRQITVHDTRQKYRLCAVIAQGAGAGEAPHDMPAADPPRAIDPEADPQPVGHCLPTGEIAGGIVPNSTSQYRA